MMSGVEPFPGYRLTQMLGRGAWSEVWRATGPGGRQLALKLIPSQDPKASVREIRALQVVRQLKHPNILRTEQVWSSAGYVIIAMELAEGSLHDLAEVYAGEYGAPFIP